MEYRKNKTVIWDEILRREIKQFLCESVMELKGSNATNFLFSFFYYLQSGVFFSAFFFLVGGGGGGRRQRCALIFHPIHCTSYGIFYYFFIIKHVKDKTTGISKQ